jgi:hypothetical protein
MNSDQAFSFSNILAGVRYCHNVDSTNIPFEEMNSCFLKELRTWSDSLNYFKTVFGE